jgi:hypothetical protein
MCDEVEFEGRVVDTPDSLRQMIGGELVMVAGCQGEPVCLCPVDLEATALKNGLAFRYPQPYDPFVSIIYERHRPQNYPGGEK